jgi:hypothetical protein
MVEQPPLDDPFLSYPMVTDRLTSPSTTLIDLTSFRVQYTTLRPMSYTTAHTELLPMSIV